MSKISGEMLAEIKHGIETGEDKNGIKVDGIAYTWKELEPLYQYIQTIQNEYKTLQKRNSRQRLANQKQYELTLKLQQENKHKDKLIDIANAGITNLQQENEKLKNRIYDLIEDGNKYKIENARLEEELKYTIPDVQHNQIVTKLVKEKNDYKSRCEKAYEELTYMSSSDYVKDYDIKQNCWIKLSNILQNGSDSQ